MSNKADMDVPGLPVMFAGRSHVSFLRNGIETHPDTFVGALEIFFTAAS